MAAKKKDEQSQALATVDEKSKALSTELDNSFAELAGSGMETVEASDIIVPRIGILQQISPQLSRKKPEFIDGAEAGHIADLGVGEAFGESILFLPVVYRKEYLEWAPRASGKGLVNIHQDAAILGKCERNDKGQMVLKDGNLIAETAQFFGFNLHPNARRRRCFLPMTSSQLKKARRWMFSATSEVLNRSDGTEFQAPLFYRTYILSVCEESNSQGDWFGWRVEKSVDLPTYCEAAQVDFRKFMEDIKVFGDFVRKGRVTIDLEPDGDNPGGAGNDEVM
jgi:hypothetical protein